jgi:hypothetical protein
MVAELMPCGAGSWTDDPPCEHMRRPAAHLEKAMLAILQGEDPLAHALVRLLFATELRERNRQALATR